MLLTEKYEKDGMDMFYITGDCHASFERFTKQRRQALSFELTDKDYVIICGDFGLLWAYDKEYDYNMDWLGHLPFKILWVQGNHENYDMIQDFPIEQWNGGKVRHIVRDKIILLERGQVFEIEGKTFFAFGGASSHDIEGGILERNDPDFKRKRELAYIYNKPFRILNEEWWEAELPTIKEMQEGIDNLEKCDYKVDYCISHCAANRIQNKLSNYFKAECDINKEFPTDRLTDYFDKLEDCLEYKHWFCGHYHEDMQIDDKHSIMYYRITPIIEEATSL